MWVIGHSMSLKLVPFKSLGMVSYLPSTVTMALSCNHFRDKVRYLSKVMIFSYPLAFDVPVRGLLWEYWHTVWYGQTRLVWLPNGENIVMICLTVSTEYRHVTDGWTDRWTSCDSIVHAKNTDKIHKFQA